MISPDRLTRYVQAAVAAQVKALEATGPGERSNATLACAFSLGRLLHLDVVPESEMAVALLTAIAPMCDHGFTETDAKKTIRRGLHRGAKKPRSVSLGEAAPKRAHRPPPPRPSAPPAHPRPPLAEVIDLWEASVPVTGDIEVADWLWYRGYDPDAIAARDLCRALPRGRVPSWARTQGGTWTETGHRCLLPAYDATGRMASVRARCVLPVPPEAKAVPPSGYPIRGLVLADAAAVQVLQGAARPLAMIIAEGETSYFRATLADGAAPVFGVVAGSWDPALTARIPVGAVVYVATDNDRSGDAYAAALRTTLGARCHLRRIHLETRRHAHA